MNNEPQGKGLEIWERLKSVPKEVIVTLIVTAVLSGIWWIATYVHDRITDTPVTANISATDGQSSIRPFFDVQIRPALGAYCGEPAWVRWLGNLFLGRQCQRIEFDPHTLANMETRRVPFNESAEPIELMKLFIERHKECLQIELIGDTYRIYEPENSALSHETTPPICP